MEHVLAPAGAWRGHLALALALAAVVLVGLELGWRALGHSPNMHDDPAAWAVRRAMVYGDHPRSHLVLLGASRIQLAIDTGALRRSLPTTGVEQLAVEGRGAVAALMDLAADERFDGVVVLDLLPEDLEPSRLAQQQGYVDAYRKGQQLERRLERRIEMEVQGRLALANPKLRLPRVLESLWQTGALPVPYALITHPDRSREGHFDPADMPAWRQQRFARDAARHAKAPPSAPDAWLERALAVSAAAARIEARGGAVLILKMPVDDERAAFEERYYPRAQYWDRFAAQSTVKVIDGRDEPLLSAFATPDSSHIDARDRTAFTLAFGALLAREGLL